MNIPLSPCVPENLVSRDGFSRPVPRQPAHLHTQAESGAYLRDSSQVPRRRPFMKPPYAIGSVPSLSGHEIAYRWRSLPRVRRHRAIKPQGSSERVLPWQVTMDQLIFASLSHTHYCYEVGMLKVPYYFTSGTSTDYDVPLGYFVNGMRIIFQYTAFSNAVLYCTVLYELMKHLQMKTETNEQRTIIFILNGAPFSYRNRTPHLYEIFLLRFVIWLLRAYKYRQLRP